jgi:hypothetical protein
MPETQAAAATAQNALNGGRVKTEIRLRMGVAEK